MGGFIRKTAKKWQLVMYITFVAGACAFFASTLVAPKYESNITILIVQKDANASSASQSVEYLSEVFSQVVHTELFFDDVLESRFNIEESFEGDPTERKQQWEKAIVVNKISNAGILKIGVQNSSRSQAHLIAQAIAENFATNSEKYHGSSDAVIVKLIDGPITSTKPVAPNIPLNTSFGLLVGLLGSIVLVSFFDSFDLKMIDKQKISDEMVKDQIEKQLRKRDEKQELVYEEESPLAEKEEETIEIKEPEETIETKEIRVEDVGKEQLDEPDLAGSMIDVEEFKDQIKPEAETGVNEIDEKVKPTEEMLTKQSNKILTTDEIAQVQDESRKNILSKLYGKSLFADKKFEKLQSKRTTHQREVDENQLPIVESVRKIKPPKDEKSEIIQATKKAGAPENLPIFLDKQKMKKSEIETIEQKQPERELKKIAEPAEERKEDEIEPIKEVKQVKLGLESNYKEFEPIEHVSGPDDESEELIEKEAETFEEVVEKQDIALPFEGEVVIENDDGSKAEKEPSEDEVKERLNKLLKGEL